MCLAGAARAHAQSGVADIERRGLRHGARPPAGFYEMVARHPGAFEFKHGWLDRARAVRQNRQALRSRGAFNLLNAMSAPGAPQSTTAVSGTLRYPTFLPLFSNTGAVDSSLLDSAAVANRFWGAVAAPPYSVTTYYQEISVGRLTVTGSVIGNGVRLVATDTFYSGGTSCQGLCTSGHVDSLIREILHHADSTIDFSQFADTVSGYVPAVVILDPQVGGECYAVWTPARNSIWAHRFSLSGWQQWRGYVGPGAYTTNDTVNGHPVVIDDYIIQGGQGQGPASSPYGPECSPGYLAPIGTVTHETGHLFGLPDLYDTSGRTEGLGHWDLMAAGNERVPNRPAHMSAWSLSFLGWISEIPLTTLQTVTADPIETSNTAYIVPIAGTQGHEFFLLENRQPIGSDSALYGPGLMIYHLDTLLMNTRLASQGNNVNALTPHALAVVEADARNELNCPTFALCNRGDRGDPFPGASKNTTLGFNTNPPSATNAGAYAGVVIDSIQQVTLGGAMKFRVGFGLLTFVRASDPSVQVRVDSVAMQTFQSLLAAGSLHTISVDSPQVSADGLTQFLFRSWSDSGARTHTITGSTAGGTYVAQVVLAYLTKFAIAGAGTVNATRTIDATNGSYLVSGDSVLLTAVPAAGQTFVGWIGDTTAGTPALLLRMAHNWSVSVVFAAQTDVVKQLLSGTSGLSSGQILVLDQAGNNNGHFDLGDFVAWFDRNPGVISAMVAARAARRGR